MDQSTSKRKESKTVEVTKQYLHRIYPAHEPNTNGHRHLVDIVFVHGLNPLSSPDFAVATWKHANGNFWPETQLPQKVSSARVLIFSYNSRVAWGVSTMGIQAHSNSLLDRLAGARKPVGETSYNVPIIFVAHSLGGLVVKQALVTAKNDDRYKDIRNATFGLVFFAVPHQGGHGAAMGAIAKNLVTTITGNSRNDLVESLKQNSLFQENQAELFKHQLEDFWIVSFREGRPTIYKGFSGIFRPVARVVVVDSKSATFGLGGMREKVLDVDANHSDICKFAGDDDSFDPVGRSISDLADTAIKEAEVKNAAHAKNESAAENSRLNRGSLNNEMLDIRRSAIAHPLGAIDEEVGMMMKEMEVVDPSSIKRDLLFEKGLPLDRTGSWIFDLPQLDENEGNSRNRDDRAAATTYTQWRSDEDSPVLLIFGRPGAGKTMLLISLIDEIHSDIPPNELFAYFFIIAARDDRNTAVSVVKSLIWQIILQQPSLARHVMHKYKIQGAQVLFTSLSALWGVLDDIVSDTALYRAYFAIDALDECQLDSLKGFLRHLDLSIDPRAKNRTHWHKIKWLFTSRDEPTVRESLHSALLVDLEKNSIHVDKAVDEYITLEVQELNKKKNYSSNLRKYVEDYIRKYANGTFLWVWLACKELAKPEILRSESKGVLLDLPPGLVPLYGRILRRITDLENPKSISVVIRILSTVLVSARPLRLRELAIAANLPETSRGNEEDILDYVRQCGSLLIIPPSDYLQSAGVSFVHQSVKDYLAPTYCPEPGFCWNSTNSGPMYCQAPESCECPKKCLSEGDYPRSAMRQTPLFPINISKAHSALAKACLEYVAANVINAGQDHNFNIASSSGEVHRGLPQALQKEFPFIDYASFFWPVHSRVPSPDIEAVMESKCVSELFAPGSTKGVVWLKRYEKLKHRKIPRKTHTLDRFYSLYVASYIGVLPLVKRVLELGADIGSSALHIAIQCEHVEIVDFLMEKGANPEVEQGVFGNLLKTAVHTKNQDLVRTMIERGANIDAQGLNYGNALYEAASSGDEGMVLLLLNLHADINAQGNRLGTALYAAAFNNHLSVLELLLKRQAMVNLQGGTFGNALQGAVSQSNARSVRLLINHNADVNAYGGRYHTALMAAVTRNSEEIVLMLLDAGADPYLGWSDHLGQRSKNRSTLMSWAVERRSEPVIRNLLAKDFLPTAEECLSIAQKGYIDLVKFCLDQGVALDLDATLENAAKNDSKAVVQLLLARGLDVTAQNGLVALNSAAKAGSIDTLELLLHSGVAVEGEKGKMAVELAAEARSANAVERLLKHGASSSYDALYSGAFGGNLGIVELLLATATPLQPDAGQHSNLIEAAVLGGNQQVVKLLLERGADVNLPGSTYGSALHAAVFKGSPSIVHLLLEYGANVNGPNDAYGCALQRAAYMGNVSIVSLLLRRGANVNSTGGRCGSPLQAAAYVNSDAVLKLLLDRDADPNAAASSGRTVLQAAIDWRDIGATLPDHTLNPNVGIPSCSVEIVSLLLDRGADAKAKGGRFGNALAAAVHWGLVEVARLLVEKGAVARPDGQVWVDAIEEAERNRATFQRDVDEDDVLMSMMVG